MEAGVPFALLSGVQLLSLAAAIGISAAGIIGGRRLTSRVPLVLGGLLLAATHFVTAIQLGSGPSTGLAVVRAVSYVLIAGGLVGMGTPVLAVVVAPIGAAFAPALAAAAAAALAAGAALRVRSPRRLFLAAAFALLAVSEVLGPPARTSNLAAGALLILRGLAALAVLSWLGDVVRRSLLAKVVGAILAAMLALALGAATVVGSVATTSLGRDQERRVQGAAEGQLDAFLDTTESVRGLAALIAICPNPVACAFVVRELRSEPEILVVVVRADGAVAERQQLDPAAALSLAQSAAVKDVLKTGAAVATMGVVRGRETKLAALGIAPVKDAKQAVVGAAIYGAIIGPDRVKKAAGQVRFDLSIFTGQRLIVSSSDREQSSAIVGEFGELDAERRLQAGESGITVQANGSRPTVHFAPIKDATGKVVAVLALSAPSRVVLETQQRVLQTIILVTVLLGLLVGIAGALLGRRIVAPIRDLTVAASRVRRGDLDASANVTSIDEVGSLSRAFDAMTKSLARSTTELRRVAADESALRARLETVLASMGDGLITTDHGGEVTSVNPSAVGLLGLEDESDLVGRPLSQVLPGVDQVGAPLVDRDVGGRRSVVGVLNSADGRRVPVVVVRRPLQGDVGEVVVVRDMTRETQIEKMKTEFLANVSHELRTPLTPIRGYADILRRNPGLPPEKTSAYADSILDSSVRMSRVVDLLVDVAALEGGRVVPEAAPVAVGPFVDARLRDWRGRAPGRTFRRRVATGLPRVLIDANWVGKALDELLDNAVKYSPSDAPITLVAGLADDPGYVRLTVRDQGRGIDPEGMSRLFTPFEQVDGSATREVGGLGLGLSFVRRLADDFGLRLHVDSTPGAGSAFSLDLPIATTIPPPRRAPRTSRSRVRPKVP